MNKVIIMFNEDEARGILNTLNDKMASIFCQPVKKVRFVFLSHISAKSGKGQVVLGQCVQGSDYEEVQILLCLGWQNTAVHELVHVYNPTDKEGRIKEITADVIKYLKAIK